MEFQPEHVFDVKRIDHLFAIGRDHRACDIDVVVRKRARQIIQQAGAVAGIDLDDRVDLGAFVIKGDMVGTRKAVRAS